MAEELAQGGEVDEELALALFLSHAGATAAYWLSSLRGAWRGHWRCVAV